MLMSYLNNSFLTPLLFVEASVCVSLQFVTSQMETILNGLFKDILVLKNSVVCVAIFCVCLLLEKLT